IAGASLHACGLAREEDDATEENGTRRKGYSLEVGFHGCIELDESSGTAVPSLFFEVGVVGCLGCGCTINTRSRLEPCLNDRRRAPPLLRGGTRARPGRRSR